MLNCVDSLDFRARHEMRCSETGAANASAEQSWQAHCYGAFLRRQNLNQQHEDTGGCGSEMRNITSPSLALTKGKKLAMTLL